MKHVAALALSLLLGACSMFQDFDEPAYTVEASSGAIEIRQYAPAVVAEVSLPKDGGMNDGFRLLFDYITGANIANKEIPMTAPVTRSAEQATSQEIPMTAPVIRQNSGEAEVMAFYMPNDFTLKTTPQPTDDRITIRELPAKRVGAIKFSGFWSDSNFQKHLSQLTEYLASNDYTPTGEPIRAYYDDPFTPWFLRRNEVMIELAE